MSNPFDLHDENSFFGKFIAIPLVLCFACCGWVGKKVEDARRVNAKKAFERGDFRVLYILEKDPEATKTLLTAAKGRYDERKPTTSLASETGIMELFAVEGVKASGFPKPQFVLKFTHPNFTQMKPSYSVIYEVFKAPNAAQKVKDWAKANNYSGWEFKLLWENEERYGSEPVEFRKAGSTVGFTAFYEAKGRLHLWTSEDGGVLDVSEGFSSRAAGTHGEEGAPFYLDFVRMLEALAK